MNLKTSELTMEYLSSYIRQNTGRGVCDSGDLYGRQYDRPLPSGTAWFDESGDYALMSLGHFLVQNCDALPNLQDAFDAFAEGSEDTWNEDLVTFFESKKILISEDDEEEDAKKYSLAHRSYTYNEDNGLDQDFVYYVFVHDDDNPRDWAYSLDPIVVIQSHNGCDARSGFSDPFFLKPKEDASFLFRLFPDLWISRPGTADRDSKMDSLEERISGNNASGIEEVMDEVGYTLRSVSKDLSTLIYENNEGEVYQITASIPQ